MQYSILIEGYLAMLRLCSQGTFDQSLPLPSSLCLSPIVASAKCFFPFSERGAHLMQAGVPRPAGKRALREELGSQGKSN